MFLCFYKIIIRLAVWLDLLAAISLYQVYANSMADKNESFILLEFFYGQNDC